MVIKECFGSFGWQVYLAKDREEALRYTKKLAGTPFLYQKFIAASAGVDVRLQVVGTEVVILLFAQCLHWGLILRALICYLQVVKINRQI